jgi:predicted NAD/FAD-binding protein
VATGKQSTNETKRIAVIGSGISGLSAAWLMSQSAPVTVYEGDNRLGGHSNTVTVAGSEGDIDVDTGFIVYNERNYPNLVELFRTVGVETQASNMSFAVSLNGGKMEYSGSGLNGLMGQRGNIVKPKFWGMLRDLLRFYREAPLALSSPAVEDVTIGEYLDANGYGPGFIDNHLLPMGAAIWSASSEEMRAYPFKAFVRFFVSHGLLTLKDRPQWRTVDGGSRQYVNRLQQDLSDIRLSTRVISVERNSNGVHILDEHGNREIFSDVVIAAHADQALLMLGDASAEERKLLGSFRYTDNEAVLHTDPSLMPKRKRTWASWNYIGEAGRDGAQSLCVTYWMNRLQNIPMTDPLFVTLNPIREIAPENILRLIHYMHPIFDRAALEAQRNLWRIQGKNGIWFCGAYCGYGFHEDGLQSGLAVAEAISGQKRPWTVANESGRIHLPPRLEAAE